MAVRKINSEPEAIVEAIGIIKDGEVRGESEADEIVGLFAGIQHESTTTKVAGEELTLRRVVLTSEWRVIR